MQNSWRRDLLWLFPAILLFFGIGLGARPYLTPSEARYIEVPRQMLVTHDWLTPRINGVPYFEKPPLFYWLQASAMQFLGTGEFAGRIVTALLASFICLITYATGRLLYDRPSGLLAATVIATCTLGYTLSRVAMTDIPISLFLTACFACFLAAQKPPSLTLPRYAGEGTQPSPLSPKGGGLGRGSWYGGMYVAAALAMLTKGLIGIAIPGMVIGAWIAITGRWRILKEARLFSGLLIFLAIAAPWHILMAEKHPDFLNFYFINEHFTRYLTDSHKRTQPWWFFIGITMVGLLPWTGLLAVIPAKAGILWFNRKELERQDPGQRPDDGNNLFLLLWIIIPLFFFSASHSKLAPYIFPIFPPCAILLGRYLAGCWKGRIAPHALRINSLITTALFAAIFVAYYYAPLPLDAEDKLDFATGITFPMIIPIVIALTGLVYVALSKRAAPILISALIIFAATVDISANYIVAVVDRANVKPLVAILEKQLHDGDQVASYGTYFQDLPIYLNHNVIVGNYTGELEFGTTHYPETRAWMLTDAEFWQRCAGDKRPLYVFMKNTTYDHVAIPANCRLRVLAKYGKTVLLEKK